MTDTSSERVRAINEVLGKLGRGEIQMSDEEFRALYREMVAIHAKLAKAEQA